MITKTAYGDVADAAETFTDDVTRGAARVSETTSEEFRRLVADAEDLIRKVAHLTDADIARVRERASKAVDSARVAMAENAKRAAASGRHIADATDGYVRERPWTALGIAAAVGLLLGASLSSRR